MAIQNVFAAGTDALVATLAKRDALARAEEQQRIENERAAAEAAATAEYRRSTLDLQNRQLDSAAADREADNAARDAAAKAKIDAEEQQRKNIERLIGVVTDPNASPQMRQSAGLMLDSMNVDPGMINNILNPKPTSQGVFRIGRDGEMAQIGEAPVGSHFVNEPAPVRPPAGSVVTPQQRLAAKQGALRQAQSELREGLISRDEVNARAAELEAISLETLGVPSSTPVPSLEDVRGMRALQGTPTPVAPPAPGTPARQDIQLGGPRVASPAPSVTPGAPPRAAANPLADLDPDAVAVATKMLQDGGKAVTPETIRIVVQRLAAR